MNLVEKEFVALVFEISSDISTMDILQEEMLRFHHELGVATNAQEVAEATEDFEFAYEQYTNHKKHLTAILETWFDHTKRLNMPVDINYFRILAELRNMEKEGM